VKTADSNKDSEQTQAARRKYSLKRGRPAGSDGEGKKPEISFLPERSQ